MKKIIGFLLVASCVFLFSCKGEDDVDYYILSTWVYVNDTEYTIEVAGLEQSFTVEPTNSHSFDVNTEGPGGGKVPVETYNSPFHFGAKITYNGKEYTITDGITERENYIAERITSNHFKFTYTFTAENLPK